MRWWLTASLAAALACGGQVDGDAGASHGDGGACAGFRAADYPVALGPMVTLVGDMNGDGWPDIVTTSQDAGNASVILNQGNGTFGAPSFFATSPNRYDSPGFAALVDLNQDGRLDLVTSNHNGDLSVLLGHGDGTLEPPITPATGSQFTGGLTIADFNGDGRLDAARYEYMANQVSVVLGTGNGGFGPPTSFPSGVVNPTSVASADFDGDGDVDLAVLSSGTASVAILRGAGDGSFQVADVYPSKSAIAFVTGDVDGDRAVDIAVTAAAGAAVLLNDGKGSFAPRPVTLSGPAYGLLLADMDGDRKVDVVASVPGPPGQPGRLVIAAGNGDGSFRPEQDVGLGWPAGVADFNRDGSMDLAFGARASVTVLTACAR